MKTPNARDAFIFSESFVRALKVRAENARAHNFPYGTLSVDSPLSEKRETAQRASCGLCVTSRIHSIPAKMNPKFVLPLPCRETKWDTAAHPEHIPNSKVKLGVHVPFLLDESCGQPKCFCRTLTFFSPFCLLNNG